MMLVIDEVVNLNASATVYVRGQAANVGDLPPVFPTDLTPQGNFYLGVQPCLLAPTVQTQDPPLSFLAAQKAFGDAAVTLPAFWPADRGQVPAYKQGLVLPSFFDNDLGEPIWIFVVADDGSMLAHTVQLFTYLSQGPGGTVAIGKSSLVDIAVWLEPKFPDGDPPVQFHALRFLTWRIKASDFDAGAAHQMMKVTRLDMYAHAPSSWGTPATQTILLESQSPLRSLLWSHGQRVGIQPSSPMLHLSLLVGDSITVKRPWLQDYQATLVARSAASGKAWRDLMMTMLWVLKTGIDDGPETPWPLGIVADIFFDETQQVYDPDWAPPKLPWEH